MTKKEKFKAYYLPWLIAMGAIFGLKFMLGLIDDEQRRRVTSIQGIAVLIGAIAFSTFVCGAIYHWFFEVYRPKRIAKLFSKIKDLDLQGYGFKLNSEARNFSGNYKGYHLTIFTDSTPSSGEWIRIIAFFVPNETHEELYSKLQKKFELNIVNNVFWFGTKTQMKFGRVPKKEKLIADINDLVDTLRHEKVEPLIVVEGTENSKE